MDYDSTIFLASISDAKDFLDITGSGDDEKLGFILSAVAREFDDYTGRTLLSEEHTEYYDGPGYSRQIALDNYPVTSSNTEIDVRIDGTWTFPESTKVDSDLLMISSTNGILSYYGYFPAGVKNIKVVYTAGYSTVPYAIKKACLEAVGFMWQRMKQKSWAQQSISQQDVTTTLITEELPSSVIKVLDKYRRIV